MASSSRNDDRKHFVDRQTIERVFAAAPDVEWRTILALARYGGLRCPSELLSLSWSEIDWEDGRFTITSQKTKRHGKGYRIVRLFPALRLILAEVFDQAKDGTVHVIARYRNRNSNLRTQLLRIIRRAGVTPWVSCFTICGQAGKRN